jgi:hypothetical protein
VSTFIAILEAQFPRIYTPRENSVPYKNACYIYEFGFCMKLPVIVTFLAWILY